MTSLNFCPLSARASSNVRRAGINKRGNYERGGELLAAEGCQRRPRSSKSLAALTYPLIQYIRSLVAESAVVYSYSYAHMQLFCNYVITGGAPS